MKNGILSKKYYFCRIDHGYIATNFSNSNETQTGKNSSEYFYGHVVGFSCNPGFKFEANHNLLAEFKIECSSTGSWTGFVPNCIPLQCPWPKLLKNGKIFLHFANKTIIDISEKNSLNSRENNTINEKYGLFTPGAKISLNCEKGYRNVGDSFRICTLNETWTNENSFCEIQNCSLENHPIVNFLNNFGKEIIFESNSEINDWKVERDLKGSLNNFELIFEGSLFGDQIIFACRNRTFFRGKDFKILKMTWKCEEDGGWRFENGENEENGVNKLIEENGRNICESIKCHRPNVSRYF